MSTESPMRAARAVILDFNGTLAEDEAVLIGIYEELLWEHGVAFDGGDYARYAGLPDKAMFGHLFEARDDRWSPPLRIACCASVSSATGRRSATIIPSRRTRSLSCAPLLPGYLWGSLRARSGRRSSTCWSSRS